MSNLKSINDRLDKQGTAQVELVQRTAFLKTLNNLNLPPNSTALSISTGDGSWDFLTLSQVHAVTKIVATDIVKNPVKLEDRKLLTSVGDWNFVQVKPDDVLPFNDETYQVIYHNDVLEHVYKPHLFIKEQYRVLKKGGGRVGFNNSKYL